MRSILLAACVMTATVCVAAVSPAMAVDIRVPGLSIDTDRDHRGDESRRHEAFREDERGRHEAFRESEHRSERTHEACPRGWNCRR